ncbi:MAG TPA: hypothetical protein VF377_06820 [Acidimicrobiia bacterium]
MTLPFLEYPIYRCKNGHPECAYLPGGECSIEHKEWVRRVDRGECVCDTEGYCPSCSVRGVYQRRIP